MRATPSTSTHVAALCQTRAYTMSAPTATTEYPMRLYTSSLMIACVCLSASRMRA